MKQRASVLMVAVVAFAGVALVRAADDSAIGSDLKATIALQGQPCDQIVSSKRNADSDYSVSCKDGNRYHVYVNAQGRVVVEKQ
ncbi:MAG TPA: hypothetical protein VN859_03700 [Steroidobacteraceae bacterium]|nr:hypothetical protein [Steroidobacteraceae bacterium]